LSKKKKQEKGRIASMAKSKLNVRLNPDGAIITNFKTNGSSDIMPGALPLVPDYELKLLCEETHSMT
jgi:hypothetical protein